MNNAQLTRFFFCLACSVSISLYAVRIDESSVKDIEACLAHGDASTICDYPLQRSKDAQPLTIAHPIVWHTPATLVLTSKEDIIFEQHASIKSTGSGSLFLKAGIENKKNSDPDIEATGSILFYSKDKSQIFINLGMVTIHYNPKRDDKDDSHDHKYHHPENFRKHIKGSANQRKSYMLVNNVYDLQDMNLFLHGNYALSQDIDASVTRSWNAAKGFEPIKEVSGDRVHGFCGNFDGNGYTISNLYINRGDEDQVGLFGVTDALHPGTYSIQNLTLQKAYVLGDHYVGSLIGELHGTLVKNISIIGTSIQGNAVVGGIIGTAVDICLKESVVSLDTSISASEYKGTFVGTVKGGSISLNSNLTNHRYSGSYFGGFR